jgi:import inner membrane translocase subunit TIM44
MYRFARTSIFRYGQQSLHINQNSQVVPVNSFACQHLATNTHWSRSEQFLLPTNQVLVTKAFYSRNEPGKRPSFFGNIWTNIKSEYDNNKDLQDSLKKFREEAKKLEESDALKEARRKFENIEGESSKGSSAIKDQFSGIADKVKGTLHEVSQAEAVKKAGEFTQNIGQKAENVSRAVGEAAENISKSGVYKSATSTAAHIKEEIEGHSLGGKVYRKPLALRKRKETPDNLSPDDAKPMEANTDATGVELHKDSKFYASWQAFRDNNPVVHKILDYRMKYEESDNPVVRGARIVTDKVHDIFGGLFTRTELSEVWTFLTIIVSFKKVALHMSYYFRS